ncbi:hypothetical protein [Micromonospora avicenniae]|uniref:Uncharacterized protein n=1 Tax=Micromonospora avicenniae TaxID=1198245 RepID=A0A1N7B784_9ACTN|nr:hypothetical protein [Micromonospora avicenniae]SIR47220.1 hypothetical protein SAMN05444858_110156 [Micromonospora avicenniae]
MGGNFARRRRSAATAYEATGVTVADLLDARDRRAERTAPAPQRLGAAGLDVIVGCEP